MSGISTINPSKRCRSPATINSSRMAPGTRCLVYLRRCLAIQLQKVGCFSATNGHSVPGTNFEGHNSEISSYWMYDSGYLIFQGFLEANLKCFWNGSLMEAMKVLEFQGYIAPGVLMVNGSACALEVIRAAWSRNVLKPPNNYVITAVGDVEDCLVEPVTQGQFTPLPEALCWIILDMTASGQPAVLESIYSTLEVAFPDMEKPSQQVVYDTLAKLMAEKKLYQTANGYFIMTPDKLRLNNANSPPARTRSYHHHFDKSINSKQLLLTPEEAVVVMHGEIETLRDGNVTHQAIQTNLADVICGGNPNDKVLYPRMPSTSKIKSGLSSERLERRHSVRFFSSGKRSSSLQRAGSMRHISDSKRERLLKEPSPPPEDLTKKGSPSLLSRIFRRSGRMKRETSVSPVRRSTFSTQFPPQEWFNRGVTHLHSIGTQTSNTVLDSDALSHRMIHELRLSQELHSKRHPLSTCSIETPRSLRRIPYSATLPRRNLSKLLCSTDCSKGDEKSQITAATILNDRNNEIMKPDSPSIIIGRSPNLSSRCSITSNKTIVNVKDTLPRNLSSPARKSMSSASSGYNSLPRSNASGRNCSSRNSNAIAKPTVVKPTELTTEQHQMRLNESSSITLHVSTTNTSEEPQRLSSDKSTSPLENSTTMTVNNNGNTKIFLQQNSPSRSLITFHNNNIDKNQTNNNSPSTIIINDAINNTNNNSNINSNSNSNNNNNNNNSSSSSNQQQKIVNKQNGNRFLDQCKPIRPSSLYEKNNFFLNSQKNDKKLPLPSACYDKVVDTNQQQQVKNYQPINLHNNNNSNNNNNNNNSISNNNSSLNEERKTQNLLPLYIETDLNNIKDGKLDFFPEKLQNLQYNNSMKEKLALEDNYHCNKGLLKYNEDSGFLETTDDLKVADKRRSALERIINENHLETDSLFRNKPIPNLSDLKVHFKSLAAQNILRGVNFNSVDTLVEVNMAAEKRNCDVNIRTDLGMV